MFDPQGFVGLQDLSTAAAACGCGCSCTGGAGGGGGGGSGISPVQPIAPAPGTDR
jgi:hypothetical protein